MHYENRDEQIAQEVLVLYRTNRTLSDESRFRLGSDQFYFKSAQQMRELFSDIPEVCEQTLEIASQINIEFKLNDESGNQIYHIPTYPTREGIGIADEMRRLAFEGLDRRFQEYENVGDSVAEENKKVYYDRLEHELKNYQSNGI